METKKPLLEHDTLSKLDKIIFNYYFSLSSIAASNGNYSLASDYLSELLKSEEESVIVIDLQAKIAAQQGKFREAEFLWKKCLKAEPDNPEYFAALNRINKVLTSKSVRFYTLFNLLKITTVFLLILILLFIFVFEIFQQEQHMTFIKEQNQEMISKIENLINLKASENKYLLDITDKMKSINGITVESNSNEISIYFNDGLFSKADIMKTNYLKTLDIISKTLSPYSGRIMVKVIGSTDSTPIKFRNNFRNNDDLSISRAKAVFDRFYESSRIPREDLMIGSLSESNTLFPNDTPENRKKNRTVFIKISLKL
jgi:flagellar motor protein MotB